MQNVRTFRELTNALRRPDTHMKRSLTISLGISLGLLSLAACGSGNDGVSIENSWARTSAAGQTTGAVYFDLTVDSDDTLLSASVPSSIAADAQIHEVVMAQMPDSSMPDSSMPDSSMPGDDMTGGDMDSGDMDSGDMGAMTMQELVNGLPLTAGKTVSFEPGSYHVMLIDIAAPLVVGDKIDLTLEFAEAGTVETTVEVAESAP